MPVRHIARRPRVALIEALEARQLLSAADLTPSITLSTLPPSVVGGSKVKGSVKVELTNSSGAAVKDHGTLSLYLSTDGAIDDTATLVTTVPHSLKVPIGGASTINVPVHSLPASLSDGTYTLLAQVTDTSGTAASTTGPSIQVAAPFVSIAASSYIVKPSVLKPGKGVSLSVVVTNNGNIATSGTGSFNIGLSTDGQTEGQSLTTLSRPLHIKPGKQTTARVHLKVPGSVPTGQFFPFISVTVDGSTSSAFAAEITIE